MATRLHLIYARAANGVIGANNTLPWHLPEDLAHFKRHTLGCPVIMGRKTWDSLPPKFRPLPDRLNLVVTRQSDWQAQGAQAAASLQDALAHCGNAPDAWVIGGAQIYAQALALAYSVVVTEIDLQVQGDAFAPELDADWRESSRESHISAQGLAYSFLNYQRATPL